MMNEFLWPQFISALQSSVVPATGCTEPVSLALASAIAAKHLGKTPERIDVEVSANLLKNGSGVTVPGTGTLGLPIAAAVGALGGDPEGKLKVIANLTPEVVVEGKRMLAEKKVSLRIADVPNLLYSSAKVISGNEWAKVIIADGHTNVIYIEHNGREVFKKDPPPTSLTPVNVAYSLKEATLHDVWDFCINCPLDSIIFMKDAGELNDALSQEGLKQSYGLHIGKTMQRQVDTGNLGQDLMTQILIRSAAASDARMGGATLPAMSNSGSGNQGIAATMPVIVLAEHLAVDDETRIRALTLSHLAAIYIHNKLPVLSALCAVTTASMGAAVALSWMCNGGYKTASMAVCNMIGDVAGVICDGASNSCAMKVSTASLSCYKAVLLALDNSSVSGKEGIVCDDVEQSIDNLCALASQSMKHTDQQIIQLMVKKNVM